MGNKSPEKRKEAEKRGKKFPLRRLSAILVSSARGFVKMALSCFLRGINSPVLKGSGLVGLTRNLSKQSCSLAPRQPTNLLQLVSGNRQTVVPLKCGSQSASLINLAKQFSTSSTMLASSYKDHDHSKLWTFERLLSVILLPLVPAALYSPCSALDTSLALVMVLHSHFGLEAIVVDYVRPILFGEVVPKISLGLLYLFSIATFAGLLNLIYNDFGLANTVRNIWKK